MRTPEGKLIGVEAVIDKIWLCILACMITPICS